MVVEFLTFEVEPACHQQWMAADRDSWTRFLEQCPGFVRKQVWIDRDDPSRIHAMIEWTDEASWKSIHVDTLTAIDQAMGEWCRTATLKVYDIVG